MSGSLDVKALKAEGFVKPGRSRGLLEVFQRQFLLSLIVHKELRVRYRGSIFGILWSYAKPAVQFIVFYFAIGVFMRMNGNIQNYVIYLFAGVIVINYFTEIFNNGTRSLTGNTPLVKKIYLPRELFPVSSVWVAFVHFIPQVVILLVGALIVGWHPGIMNLLVILAAFITITIFGLGLGLLAGAINVLYRDAENMVELLLMVATWASPVLYTWQMVHSVFQGSRSWLWTIYQLNPITPVIEMFHWGFWGATEGANAVMPPNMVFWGITSFVISLLTLVLGEAVFRRLDGRFAQEL